MCNSQLWLRSESTCIPRKVFSVQKSDETSYPIMYSQSQDMLLLSHGGRPQSQYIYGNPPLKNTLAREVVSLLSQDHRLPAFWCRHVIWPTICQLRLENSGLKPWGDLCRTLFPRVLPQSSVLPWGFPPGMLRCCPSLLWGQLTSRMDPLWLDQLPPFILCKVQTVLFSRCALILKRLWSCYVCYTVSLGSSLTPCLDSSAYSVENWEFRMGSYWSSSLLTPGWEPISGLVRPPSVFWSWLDYYPILVAQKLVCWPVLA